MTTSKTLIALLSLLLSFPPQLLAQLSTSSNSETENQISGIEKMVSFARRLRTNLNRQAFEFDPLLDSLDYDSASIIQFVKTSVAFEQYPGLLRGPGGTLQGLAGNALDQSVLLAKLLRDAGYDARIAKTALTSDQARQVLRQVLGPVQMLPPLGDGKALFAVFEESGFVWPETPTEEQIAEFENFVASEPNPRSSPLYKTVLKNRDQIVKVLNGAELNLSQAATNNEMVEEAREYFWVQFKDSSAQSWSDVHPVFSGESPIGAVVPTEVFSDSIPERYQHRLRFEVLIEKKVGDRLLTFPVTESWERPIANLNGIAITFSNMPNSLLAPDAQARTLEEMLENATSFVPVMEGAMAPGAQYFDLNGILIDPMVATNQAAGVFKEVGRGFMEGIQAIGGNKQVPVLTAQILKFTLISPGGEEKVFRRTTFDRIGPAARASGNIPSLSPAKAVDIRAVMQRHSFMVATGKTHRAFAMDFAAERLIAFQPEIEAQLKVSHGQKPQTGKVSEDWVGLPSLLTKFDRAESLSPDHRIYRSGPGLVIYRDGLAAESGEMAAVDIVTNPRRAIRLNDQLLRSDAKAVMLAGVWETKSEGVLLLAGDAAHNTENAFKWAGKNQAQTIVIAPGQEDKLPKLSADTLAAVRADLSLGYAVMIPDREPVPGKSGWWRVSLETGETLGQFGDGRGGEVTEYLTTQQVSQIISLLFYTYGVTACATSGQSSARVGCCIAINMAFFMAGAVVEGLSFGQALVFDIATSQNSNVCNL